MNKNGEECKRPWEKDEVLLAKGKARELFERGGRVNKDSEETENEMVEKKKSTNTTRPLHTPYFLFSVFSLLLPAGKGLLSCDSCSFSG